MEHRHWQTARGMTPATLYTVLLPLNYNDGRPIPSDRLDHAVSEIMDYASGLTLFALGNGCCVRPGLGIDHDLIQPLQVAVFCPSGHEEWFLDWATRTAILLEQRQIFLFAQPVWVLESSELESQLPLEDGDAKPETLKDAE